MKKIFLSAIILGYCFDALGQYWAPIFTDNDSRRVQSNSALVIDNHLVFKTGFQSRTGLWVYNSSNKQTTELSPGNGLFIRSELVAFGSSVYFLVAYSNEPNSAVIGQRLWKIDDGFMTISQVSEQLFSSLYNEVNLAVHDDLLFIRSDAGIVAYDGETFTTFESDLSGIQVQDICVFDRQHLVFYNNNLSLGATLIGINQSITTDYTDLLPVEPKLNRLVKVDDSCYFHYTQSNQIDDPNGFLKITKTGSTQLYGEDEIGFEYQRIFIHNNEKFALTNGGRTLSKLAADDTVSEDILTLNMGYFDTFKSTTSHLYFLQQRNDNKKSIFSIDQNLTVNLVETGLNLRLPIFSPYPTADIRIVTPTHRTLADQFNINFQEFNGQQTTLLAQGYNYIDTISSVTSDDLYFILKDITTGKRGVYALTDVPTIGAPLNGIWYDPKLENQGLMIRHGTRTDGSNYIFATVYTFVEGQALWLAGNADYDPGQQSILINLSDFQGGEFFATPEDPVINSFGQINIELQNCNELRAVFSNNILDQTLNLTRIDNSFDRYCLQ